MEFRFENGNLKIKFEKTKWKLGNIRIVNEYFENLILRSGSHTFTRSELFSLI